MYRTLITSITPIILFCLLSISRAAIFNTAFCPENLELYIVNPQEGVVSCHQGSEQGGLKIAGHAGRVDMHPIRIAPEKKYKLSLRARIDSDFVIEKNDRALAKTLHSVLYRSTSTYELTFFDKLGEPIVLAGYGGRGFVLTADWHNYVYVFYTPPGAKELGIRFNPNRHTMYIDHLELADSDESAVNINPEFSYGKLNYCGWRPQREGRLHERPDGKVVFRPGYGGSSSYFPLRADYRYRMSARGSGGRINLVYFNKEGGRIQSRHLLRPTEQGETVEIVPPGETSLGRILMYGITALEEFRVELLP